MVQVRRDLGDHRVQPPARAGSPTAGCPGLRYDPTVPHSFPAPGLVGTSCQTGWTEHHEAPGMDIENLVPRVHPGTTIPTALHSPCECCPALTSLHPSTAGARRGWHGPDLEKLEVGAKEHKLGPPHLRAVPSRLQNTSTALREGAVWILGPRALPAASSASPQNASPLLMQHRVGPSHA